jgi:hypothetical protein
MHRLHERTLRRMFQIEEKPEVKLSDEVVTRVMRAENRSLKCFGSMLEMTADTLFALIADLSDEESLSLPVGEKEGVDFSKLKRPKLIDLCDKTEGIEIKGSEKTSDLVAILEKHKDLVEV